MGILQLEQLEQLEQSIELGLEKGRSGSALVEMKRDGA